jgi:3'(2'), 5'-bisphosphate nucleotidase
MKKLLLQALTAAVRAGNAILEVYHTDFSVTHKADNSPLTLADRRSHEIITTLLAPFKIPILSEEGRDIPYSERKRWNTFWLIDPLDGTKEFVKRNDEFTVNIALIENQSPVMGVIFVPVSGVLYFAQSTLGAFKLEAPALVEAIGSEAGSPSGIEITQIMEAARRLPLSAPSRDPYIIVGSRSHLTPEVEAFVEKKRREYPNVTFISAGSSLKLCQVAEGRAAIYPRLGPTMEWDTAAGHAIAARAGARVVRNDTGSPLRYNKENLLNPWFIVEWWEG